jgi:hypothetical protein
MLVTHILQPSTATSTFPVIHKFRCALDIFPAEVFDLPPAFMDVTTQRRTNLLAMSAYSPKAE